MRLLKLNRQVVRIFTFVILCSYVISLPDAYGGIATISVSPVTRTITLKKGETTTVVYTAYNPYDIEQYVTIIPRYWRMKGANRDIPIDSWLKIEPKEFNLGPNEKRDIKFTVTAPQDAVGELTVMVAFKPKPGREQAVNIVFSISLYVMILGTERIEYTIRDFKLWKIEKKKAFGTEVALSNSGNVHLRPRINVLIYSIFNKLLQKAELRYGEPVYPGEVRDYRGAIYNFKLKPGLYKAVIDGEITNIADRFRKTVYFLVGWKGKVVYVFFKRPKG